MVRDIISKLEELDGITTKIHKTALGLEFMEICYLNHSIAIGSINKGNPKHSLGTYMFPEGQSEMLGLAWNPKDTILYFAIHKAVIISNGPLLNVTQPRDCIEIDLESLILIIRFLSHPKFSQYFVSNLTYAVKYGWTKWVEYGCQDLFKFLGENTDFSKYNNKNTN